VQVLTGIPIVSIEAVKITETIEITDLFPAIATVIREAIALQAIADLPHLQVTRQDQTIIGEAVLQEATTGTVRLMTAALQATIGTILLHIMAMVLQQITAEALRLHLMTAVLQAATAEAVHLHLMVAVLPEAIAEVHQVQVPAQKAVIQDHPVEVREEDTGDKIIRIFTVNFKTRKTI